MNFARNLQKAMDECQMTQKELATRTGIGKSSISQYLSGKNIPTAPHLRELAETLNTDVDSLTRDEVQNTDDISEMKNVPIKVAAERMGKSQQFVRVALQRGAVSFGFAVKTSGKYSYYISPQRLAAYLTGGQS